MAIASTIPGMLKVLAGDKQVTEDWANRFYATYSFGKAGQVDFSHCLRNFTIKSCARKIGMFDHGDGHRTLSGDPTLDHAGVDSGVCPLKDYGSPLSFERKV